MILGLEGISNQLQSEISQFSWKGNWLLCFRSTNLKRYLRKSLLCNFDNKKILFDIGGVDRVVLILA